jgi:hypothetical protein
MKYQLLKLTVGNWEHLVLNNNKYKLILMFFACWFLAKLVHIMHNPHSHFVI